MKINKTFLIIGGIILFLGIVVGVVLVLRHQNANTVTPLQSLAPVVHATSTQGVPVPVTGVQVSPSDQQLRVMHDALEKSLPKDISATWDAQTRAQQLQLIGSKKRFYSVPTSTK